MSASPVHFCWFFNTKLSQTPAQLFSAPLLTTMKSRNTFFELYPAQPILIFVFDRNAWSNFSLGSFVSYYHACDVPLNQVRLLKIDIHSERRRFQRNSVVIEATVICGGSPTALLVTVQHYETLMALPV